MKKTLSANLMATDRFNRRELLRRTTGLTALGALALPLSNPGAESQTPGPAVKIGHIRQSVAQWCFEATDEKWTVEKTCQVAKELGLKSVELVATEHYPTLKKYGLICALCQINMNPDPPFVRGFNNEDNWPQLFQATREAIDAAGEYGYPNVIAFTGFSAKNPSDPNSPQISREEGIKNCVAGLRQIMGQAERKKVNLCLEMLSTHDTTHPMKGHPGYQGNSLEFCLEIIKQVNSPRLKLLFDVYHVQIMDGDIIRHLRECRNYLGHVHVAGVPGRGNLDDNQEVNFPPIMRALIEMGYHGYVGHEFIPTGDPYAALRAAVTLCDV